MKPIKSNTATNFSSMLNDVLTSNGSYAAKHIKLKELGLPELEIKKVLKQYKDVLEKEQQSTANSIFLDTRNAKKPTSSPQKGVSQIKKSKKLK